MKTLLITFFLLSCVNAFAKETVLRPVVLQLKWMPQFQFAGYYVAKELGYYADVGLDVEVRAGGAGLSSLVEVMEGRADFGVGNSNILAEHMKGKPVQALAAIFQYSPSRIMTLESSGIDTAEKLIGHRIMLRPGNENFEILTLLTQLNLVDKVTRLPTSYSVDSLINKETDAYHAYANNEPYELDNIGLGYNLIDPADYGINFYGDVLFTHQDMGSSDPSVVRAFTQASLKGWEEALQNPERAIKIVAQYATHKTLSHLRYEALAMHGHMQTDLVPVGYMNIERWIAIKDLLVSIGDIPANETLNLDTFIFPLDPEQLIWQKYWKLILLGGVVLAILLGLTVISYIRGRQLEGQLDDAYQKAMYEPLTGLANRYLFNDRFNLAMSQRKRTNITQMLVFLDVDNFKQINDSLGHQAGDDFLVAIASALKTEIRPSDTLARFGGDEFAFIFTDLKQGTEHEICNRIYAAVMEAIQQFDLIKLGVDVSIGALVIDINMPTTPEQLLVLVDREMYAVKASKDGKIRIAYLSKLKLKYVA